MTGIADGSRYHRDGYVVLEAALSPTEMQALRDEAVRICRGELGAVEGVQRAGAEEPDELVVRHSCASPLPTSCPNPCGGCWPIRPSLRH